MSITYGRVPLVNILFLTLVIQAWNVGKFLVTSKNLTQRNNRCKTAKYCNMDFFLSQVPTPLATRILLCAKLTMTLVKAPNSVFNLLSIRGTAPPGFAGLWLFDQESNTLTVALWRAFKQNKMQGKICKWYMYVETKTEKKHYFIDYQLQYGWNYF